jgi:hypothetical protein
MSRARRRDYRKIIEARVRRKIRASGWIRTEAEIEGYVKRHRDNRTSCSCWMCKRYAGGKSRSTLLNMIDSRVELDVDPRAD